MKLVPGGKYPPIPRASSIQRVAASNVIPGGAHTVEGP